MRGRALAVDCRAQEDQGQNRSTKSSYTNTRYQRGNFLFNLQVFTSQLVYICQTISDSECEALQRNATVASSMIIEQKAISSFIAVFELLLKPELLYFSDMLPLHAKLDAGGDFSPLFHAAARV